MTIVGGIEPATSTVSTATVAMDTQLKSGRIPKTEQQEGARFSLGDFVDVINPLQHIPGIAEIYRAVTNDHISDEARKTGNAIFGFALGGPVGLGAMLAYNAIGDRLYGAPDQDPVPTVHLAGAEPDEKPQDLPDIPIPDRKPGAPKSAEPVNSLQNATVLGESVAATGTVNAPLNLHDLLSGTSRPSPLASVDRAAEPESPEATLASSIAYVEDNQVQEAQRAAVPDEEGLGLLAAHQSNHLPLEVLKALQERHAQRTASERS